MSTVLQRATESWVFDEPTLRQGRRMRGIKVLFVNAAIQAM